MAERSLDDIKKDLYASQIQTAFLGDLSGYKDWRSKRNKAEVEYRLAQDKAKQAEAQRATGISSAEYDTTTERSALDKIIKEPFVFRSSAELAKAAPELFHAHDPKNKLLYLNSLPSGANPWPWFTSEWEKTREQRLVAQGEQNKIRDADLSSRREQGVREGYQLSELALAERRAAEFDKFREMQQRNKDLQGASAGVAKDPYEPKQEGVQVVEQEENQTNVVGGKKPKLNTEQTNRV